MTMPPQDKRAFEVTLVNRLARNTLMSDGLRLWNNLRSTHRVYLKAFDKIICWSLINGKPHVEAEFKLTSFGARLDSGLFVHLVSPSGVQFDVGHTPRKIPGYDAFLWLPTFSEVRWAPADYASSEGAFRCTIPMCFKQRCNKDKELVEGVIYVHPAREYKVTWPDQQMTY